jgi:hypothetical protein
MPKPAESISLAQFLHKIGRSKTESVTCCNNGPSVETRRFPHVFSFVPRNPGDTVANLHRLGESSRAAAVDNVRSRHGLLLIVANCNY